MSLVNKVFGKKDSGNKKTAVKKCIPCGELNSADARFCYSCGCEFPSANDHFDAFISYRRETGSDLASLLKVQLENKFHKKIFLDVKELQVGRFDEALLNKIGETPNFILILSKSSLDRCKEKSDWLKREIMHALSTRRNIIPLMIKDFNFPSEDLWANLPPEMRVLSSLNGIKYDHILQDSAIRMIASYMKSAEEVPPVNPVTVEVPKEPDQGSMGTKETNPVKTEIKSTPKPSEPGTPVKPVIGRIKKEIYTGSPDPFNPECIVFLKRGENLKVGTRDSKDLSFYYGPGTVLEYKEKGKDGNYPWYRFQGADGKDYWFDGPGPMDTIDRRVFFRIAETDQVGYMVEILGERIGPWGSVEGFKLDDNIVGLTELKFEQIVSMTSEKGEMSVRKESGVVSGCLQKMSNYMTGFTKGPCLVTSDAVIPLVCTNRVNTLTVNRINEDEKPPLAPIPVYSDRSQLKFRLLANSETGHFDNAMPDIYMLLDEQSLGRIRIFIPMILKISVDTECKEAPVTVETLAGNIYKGTCNDKFDLSGSVFSFDTIKKNLVLEALGPETTI